MSKKRETTWARFSCQRGTVRIVDLDGRVNTRLRRHRKDRFALFLDEGGGEQIIGEFDTLAEAVKAAPEWAFEPLMEIILGIRRSDDC